MKIVDVPTKSLKPYKNNPRDNDSAVEDVANSINEYGFQQPIVVDKNKIVIIGHTRLKAALKLGLPVVPAIVATDLSAKKVKELRIADNVTGEAASWDIDKLFSELSVVSKDGDYFTGFKFDQMMNEATEMIAGIEEDTFGESKKKAIRMYVVGDTKLEDVQEQLKAISEKYDVQIVVN